MDLKKPNVVVQIKTKINAPAGAVWEILGKQFSDISKWTSVVESSKAITIDEIPPNDFSLAENAPTPARQTISVNGGRRVTLIEVLTLYSDENRVLKFYGLGLPGFIAFATDKQSVISTGQNECVLVFEVEMRLKGIFKLFKSIAKRRFAKNFKKVQSDLKVYAETGRTSK